MDILLRALGWVAANPDTAGGLAGMAAALFGLFRRWAVANRQDSLAGLAGAAARLAGDVATQLANTPVGMKPADFAMALIRGRAEAMIAEFDKTAPIVGATPEKLAGMAYGALGQIMGPAAPTLQIPVAARAEPQEMMAR